MWWAKNGHSKIVVQGKHRGPAGGQLLRIQSRVVCALITRQ